MSLQSVLFNIGAAKSDRRRDAAIPLPKAVAQCRNISYGPHGDWNLLDVYTPDSGEEALPTIVSIHGGGYVYGSKEIYRRYGMDMARRGFAFINFNYRLAPKWRFPAPLHDTNAVMAWICVNAHRYRLDPGRIILVGDSAGAQLASQYAAIATNSSYASLFRITVPRISIRALGLNCGMYDLCKLAAEPRKGLHKDYLGSFRDLPREDPRLRVLESVTSDYPPALITTSCHDFLRANAAPMWNFLTKKDVPCQWKCYGSEDDPSVGHVFHINISVPEAIKCNDDSAAFFRNYI